MTLGIPIIGRCDKADSPACSMPRDTTTTLANVMLPPPQFRAPLPSLHCMRFRRFRETFMLAKHGSWTQHVKRPTVAFPPTGSNTTAAVATMGTRHVPLTTWCGGWGNHIVLEAPNSTDNPFPMKLKFSSLSLAWAKRSWRTLLPCLCLACGLVACYLDCCWRGETLAQKDGSGWSRHRPGRGESFSAEVAETMWISWLERVREIRPAGVLAGEIEGGAFFLKKKKRKNYCPVWALQISRHPIWPPPHLPTLHPKMTRREKRKSTSPRTPSN